MTGPSPKSFLLIATLLVLAGCGGGGGGPPVASSNDGIGGTAAFVTPVEGGFDCDVADGAGFGHYQPGIRPAGLDDHYGIDLAVPIGRRVLASRGGTVLRAAWHPDLGNVIVIECDPLPGYAYVYNLYAHLKSMLVNLGDEVGQGAILGTSGDTGALVDGSDLHFEFVHSSTAMQWSSSGPTTPTTRNYTQWRDPALHVVGLGNLVGPGPSAAPPAPTGPGDFWLTSNHQNRVGDVVTLSIAWTASANADSYQVVFFHWPEPNYMPPGGYDALTTGYSVESQVLGPTTLSHQWELDMSEKPEGTYIWKVLARNASGSRMSRTYTGYYFPN